MISFLLAFVVSSCTKNVRPDRFNTYFFLLSPLASLLYPISCFTSTCTLYPVPPPRTGSKHVGRRWSVNNTTEALFRKSRLNRRKLPYGIFTISLYFSIILFYPPPPTTQFDQCFSSSFNLLLVQCVCDGPTFTSCNAAFQNLKMLFFAVGDVT